jgi:hypothetical protein
MKANKVKLNSIQKYVDMCENPTIKIRCIGDTDIVDSISWFSFFDNGITQGERIYVNFNNYNTKETIEAIKRKIK